MRELNMSYNKIIVFEEDSLRGCENLAVLDLSYNQLQNWTSIAANALLPAKKLLRLDLSYNTLRNDYESELKSDSLEELKLTSCSISAMKEDFLVGFPNLRKLDLSYNKLKEFRAVLELRKLEELVMYHARVENVQSDVFKNLESLRKLVLAKNHRLKHLNLTSPSLREIYAYECNLESFYGNNLPNLTVAVFHGNRFRHVPIMNLRSLQYLDFSNNTISTVHTNTFNKLPSINFVKLTYNTISSIPRGAFSTNFKLVNLDLSHNYLSEMTKFDMESLKVLDLSNCEINTVKEESMEWMRSLEELDLSRNPLSKIPNNLQADNLRSLDLSFCRISTINNMTFKSMPKLRILHLEGNRLNSGVKRRYFHNITNISLEDNAWGCDCDSNDFHELYEWLTEIRNDVYKLTCQSPEKFEGMQWEAACFAVWYKTSHSEIVICLLISFTSLVLTLCVCLSIRRAYRRREEAERQADLQRIQRLQLRQAATRREGAQNAPDPRELQTPPSYNEALLLPRIDGSTGNLATSLSGSRKSLNSSDRKENRQRVRRKRRKSKVLNEDHQSSSKQTESDSEAPRPAYMESNI